MLVFHGNLVLFYSMLLGTFVWNVQYGSCSWSLLEFEEAGMVAARVNNHLLQVSHCKQTETARDQVGIKKSLAEVHWQTGWVGFDFRL